jgi:hypothetical protein
VILLKKAVDLNQLISDERRVGMLSKAKSRAIKTSCTQRSFNMREVMSELVISV